MTTLRLLSLHPLVPRFWLFARSVRVALARGADELVERAPHADLIVVPTGALAGDDVERLDRARRRRCAQTALLLAARNPDDAAAQGQVAFDNVLAHDALERHLAAFVVRWMADHKEAA